MHLIKLDANSKTIAEWLRVDGFPEPNLMNVTGRTDGPTYMGRTYNRGADTFSPYVPPDDGGKAALLAKPSITWTLEDVADGIKLLL